MEKDGRYTLVGGFVVLTLVLFGFAFAWLLQSFEDEDLTTYLIDFRQSIAGLQEGSQVHYRGVPVGRVTSIELDPQEIRRILVGIAIKPTTPVREDTIAALASQGITGLATIELKGGSNQGKELVATDDGPAIIKGAPSTLDQVFQSTPELLVKAVTVADRVTLLLSDDNLQNIENVIADLSAISDGLGDSESGLRPLITDLRTSISSLDETLVSVGNLSTAGSASLETFTATADSLALASRRIGRLVNDISEPLGDFSNGGLYEISKLVSEMRQLTAAMSRIALEFERNPAGYLLGGGSQGFTPE